VVQAAVSDIIGPTVSTDDPYGLLHEVVFQFIYLVQQLFVWTGGLRQREHERRAKRFIHFFGFLGVVALGNPSLEGRFRLFIQSVLDSVFHQHGDFVTRSGDGERDTVSVFGVIFEQRIRPSGSFSFRVRTVRRGGGASAVDGRTAGRVGDDHPFSEKLGQQSQVRGFSTAAARAVVFKERLIEQGRVPRRVA